MPDSRFRGPGSLLRYVCVFAYLLLAVTGCSHPLPDYVSKYTTPPPEPPITTVAVIGDPYTSGESIGTQAWAALVAEQLRQQNINIDLQVAADGAGSAPAGTDGDALSEQVQQVVRPTTKLVVVFGYVGETGGAAAEPASAVKRAVAEVKKTAPEAKLLVIGPAWTNGQPPQTLLTIRHMLRAEAQATGATFIDPIADGWFVNQPDLVGPDKLTLTDAGHAYLADKIAPLIAQQLQPLPAGAVATPR